MAAATHSPPEPGATRRLEVPPQLAHLQTRARQLELNQGEFARLEGGTIASRVLAANLRQHLRVDDAIKRYVELEVLRRGSHASQEVEDIIDDAPAEMQPRGRQR